MPDTTFGYTRNETGIYVPPDSIAHCEEHYDSATFELLHAMQQHHFWYRGRHRFLLHALKSQLAASAPPSVQLDAVDLGGGCGGWVNYLRHNLAGRFRELALADSSCAALELAKPSVGESTSLYQIDLLNLQWINRWDVAFLLDVLEHIPEDVDTLRQIRRALKPGGLLFVTTPALKFFWTHNDEMVRHVRRYSRAHFAELASSASLECVTTRYFMFFLSPLLLASRLTRVDVGRLSRREIQEHLKRTHRIPPAPVNQLLASIFAAETPLGHFLPFPWGTSILGVFRKPAGSIDDD